MDTTEGRSRPTMRETVNHETARQFGPRLRWWRNRRGLSQLALAGAAGTTQRNLSFL
jgi:hypothetical protein